VRSEIQHDKKYDRNDVNEAGTESSGPTCGKQEGIQKKATNFEGKQL